MFSAVVYLTYIDTDGKREIYAPFRSIEAAKEAAKDNYKFNHIMSKNPNHDLKLKVKIGVGKFISI